MAFSIGSFSASLGIDTSGWSGGLTAANAVTAVFGQHVTNFMTNPILGAVGAMGAITRGIASAGAAALDQAESMLLLERTTGLSLDAIQAYTKILKDNGLEAAELEVATQRYAQSIAEARSQAGPAREALAKVKLNPDDLEPGARSMGRFLDGLKSITDEGERVDIAKTVLGKGGAVFGAFADEIDSLIPKMRSAQRIIDSDVVRSVGNLDDKVDRVKGTFQGLKDTLTFTFLGAIDKGIGDFGGPEKLAEAIKTKLVPEVVAFGEAIGRIADRMDEMAQAAETIGTALDVAKAIPGAMFTPTQTAGRILGSIADARERGRDQRAFMAVRGIEVFDLARRAMR